jgi:hypothetical protein
MTVVQEITSSTLPVNLAGSTVSVRGPLTASTIALVCTAVDFLHDVGAAAITVDLRGSGSGSEVASIPIPALGAHGPQDKLVRLLLPLASSS